LTRFHELGIFKPHPSPRTYVNCVFFSLVTAYQQVQNPDF
jgi:hypothetical protein